MNPSVVDDTETIKSPIEGWPSLKNRSKRFEHFSDDSKISLGHLLVHYLKSAEYLDSVISSWKKHYSDHNVAVKQWKSDLNVYRESTYISCWNRASSMSLAMWEMNGGTEAVLQFVQEVTSCRQ